MEARCRSLKCGCIMKLLNKNWGCGGVSVVEGVGSCLVDKAGGSSRGSYSGAGVEPGHRGTACRLIRGQ